LTPTDASSPARVRILKRKLVLDDQHHRRPLRSGQHHAEPVLTCSKLRAPEDQQVLFVAKLVCFLVFDQEVFSLIRNIA
jgi:hypothetical protein